MSEAAASDAGLPRTPRTESPRTPAAADVAPHDVQEQSTAAAPPPQTDVQSDDPRQSPGAEPYPIPDFSSAARQPQPTNGSAATDPEQASDSMLTARGKDFVAYNPWMHDISVLAQLEARPPVTMDAEQTRALAERQLQERVTNAALRCADVIGFNFKPTTKATGSPSVVAHADDEFLIYAAGQHFTMAHMQDALRRTILYRAPGCLVVNCFTVSAEGKYIAVSERHVDNCLVSIYKIDTSTKITSIDMRYMGKSQVTALHLSSNNRFLATVSADPDAKLVMWQLDDVKAVGIADLPRGITMVRVCPWDSMQIAVVGRGRFILWKLLDRSFIEKDLLEDATPRFLSGVRPHSMAACAWYDDDCVAGLSAEGLLIAIEDGEPKAVKQVEAPIASVKYTHIEWASRGLFVGGTGVVILLDRTYDADIFTQVAVVQLPASVCSISISPAELNIVVATSDNTVRYCSMSALDDAVERAEKVTAPRPEPTAIIQATPRDETMASARAARLSFAGSEILSQSVFSITGSMTLPRLQTRTSFSQNVYYGAVLQAAALLAPIPHVSFHSEAITSVSMAVQKPILMTTSADCTVRFYDYEQRKVVLVAKMEDPVTGGAIHPMGLHFMVAFEFYVQVFAILPDGVFPLADIELRDVHGMQISSLGGRVAFAVQSRVFVYDFYSHQQVGALIGHTSIVKSIHWSHLDSKITVADASGVISCWSATTFLREELESPHKSLIMQCAKYHEKSGLFLAVGSRKHRGGNVAEGEFTILSTTPGEEIVSVFVRPGHVLPRSIASLKRQNNLFVISQLSNTMIVGTVTGQLQLYSLPLLPCSQPFATVSCHAGEIVQMFMSPDDRFLFSMCAEGVMYVFNVEQCLDGKAMFMRQSESHLFDSVRYTQATELTDLDRDISFLRVQRDETRTQNREVIAAITQEHESHMRHLKMRSSDESERLRREMVAMVAAKTQAACAAVRQAETAEATYIHTQEDIEKAYDALVQTRTRELQALTVQRDSLVVAYEHQIQDRKVLMEDEVLKVDDRRQEIQRKYQSELNQIRTQIHERNKTNDGMVNQTIVDFEEILKRSRQQHQHTMKMKEEAKQHAATAAMFGDREAERLQRDIVQFRATLEARETVVKELQGQLERRTTEVDNLKKEMLAKQNSIDAVEKKMQQLKVKLNLLENVRFVLSYQYDQLRDEVVPKDVAARNLTRCINNKEEQLGVMSLDVLRMKREVDEVTDRCHEMKDANKKLLFERKSASRKLDVLLCDLQRCVDCYKGNCKADNKRMVKMLGRTVQRAKESNDFTEKEADPDTEAMREEIDRHESYLEAKRVAAHHYASKSKLMRNPKELIGPNSDLLRESTALRTSLKQLQGKFVTVEGELRDVRVNLHRIASQPVAAIADRPFRTRALTPDRRAGTPPLQSLASKPGTPLGTAADSSGTSRSIKTPSHSAVPSFYRKAQATQLQRVVDQLDANTQQLRTQQKEVQLLRSFVQHLLAAEEKRLTAQLGPVGPTPFGSTPGPLGDDSRAGTGAADLESPDWTAKFQPHPLPQSPEAGATMAEATMAEATMAEATALGPAEPLAEAAEPLAPVEDGRPMTPKQALSERDAELAVLPSAPAPPSRSDDDGV